MSEYEKQTVEEQQPEQEQKGSISKARRRSGKRPSKIKKKHIKWYVLGVIVIIIAGVVITCTNKAKEMMASITNSAEYVTLEYVDLRDTISATGIVESAEKTNVYSTMSYQIQEVLVRVGDVVQEGDVLLQLDRESIEKQIKEKELAIENTEKSGEQSVKSARDTYSNYKEGLEEGTNSSLISANSSVQTAYDNYQKAIRTYEDYEKTLKQGSNAAVSAQLTACQNAEQALIKAQQNYNAAVAAQNAASTNTALIPAAQAAVAAAQANVQAASDAYIQILADFSAAPPTATQQDVTDAEAAHTAAKNELKFAQEKLAELTKSDLSANVATAKATLDSAARAMDDADAAYTAALESANRTLREYKIAIDTAYTAYETALASRTSTEVAADNQLNAYRNSLETARIAAGGDLSAFQLEEMRKDLEKASITAPVSGTITAVYATVGATSSGLLFVIEDTNQLIVDTNIKEFDIGTVRQGMPVSIKSDATNDDVFDGTLSLIAPAANKNALGNTDTTSDALFAAEVTVVSQNTPLRIGMSVRLEFIVEEAQNALAVPYDAVYENASGQTCVMVAIDQGDNTRFLLTEIPVTTGMENDLDIAISGEGLAPGMRIITSPAAHTPGTEIVLLAPETMRQIQSAGSGNSGAIMFGGPSTAVRRGG